MKFFAKLCANTNWMLPWTKSVLFCLGKNYSQLEAWRTTIEFKQSYPTEYGKLLYI